MDIGMIVYSLSGHTLSVAKKLQRRLLADGHTVTLKQIEIVGPATLQNEDAELKTKPGDACCGHSGAFGAGQRCAGPDPRHRPAAPM